MSKDAAIRHNHIEVLALLRANAHAFLLTAASCTGQEMAAALVQALPQIANIVQKRQPPLIATVSKQGRVRIRLTYADLGGRE
ncbi:MAG: hypothetical protein DCC68_14150 [Planctomycetota bacterium]|nr:MAG: hypothetical protein DCC68_14150 [Planctomycetota bacterium]